MCVGGQGGKKSVEIERGREVSDSAHNANQF